MPCYHPLNGYLAKEVNASGKRSIVFNPRDALGIDVVRQVPCGRCIGCRLERSRQWAVRCVHEASLWKENCFITLTYNDDNLPENGSLVVSDFQKFFKRLRKKFGDGIRFFHCGEYGDQLSRPHYHACIFNFDFSDKKLWSIREGVRLYRSAELEKLWSFGFATVGDVTFESAAYVARYCVKKVVGKDAKDYYKEKKPEYVTMSRRPGIGKNWFDKFKDDVYPHDYLVIRGKRCKPVRYYDNLFDLTNSNDLSIIKSMRKREACASPDNSLSRLAEREVVKRAQVSMLKRGMV